MASTASEDLMKKAFELSKAEKAFHPWWDNMEDYLVYGLIMIGLAVVRTEMLTSTSLDCNYCKDDFCKDYEGETYQNNMTEDPGISVKWVKQFCTYDPVGGAVDHLVLFYPYVLLSMGLSLLLTQRTLSRGRTYSKKMNQLYTFVAAVWEGKDQTDLEAYHTKIIFMGSSDFYYRYLFRTISLLALASGYIGYFVSQGWRVFDEARVVICKTHQNYYYECHGIPYFFYLCSFYVTSVIMIAFILLEMYNLLWLLVPRMSQLWRVMEAYRTNMRRSTSGAEVGSDCQLLGDLHHIYYSSRDLSLLLNLLAAGSGVAESLVILTALDQVEAGAQVELKYFVFQKFKENLKPEIEYARRSLIDGKAQIKLKVSSNDITTNDQAKIIRKGSQG